MPMFRQKEEIVARRVALDNMEQLAFWCGGSVLECHNNNNPGVRWHNPLNGETTAYVGMWIVRCTKGFGGSFLAMNDAEFQNRFIPVPSTTPPVQQAESVREKVLYQALFIATRGLAFCMNGCPPYDVAKQQRTMEHADRLFKEIVELAEENCGIK